MFDQSRYTELKRISSSVTRSLLSTSTRPDGERVQSGVFNGRATLPRSVSGRFCCPMREGMTTLTSCDLPGLHYPYVLAFEPSFVEVRHVETGNLVQIISGTGIRCLFAETPPSTVNAPAPMPMYRPGMPLPPHNPYGAPQQPPYGYTQAPSQQQAYTMGPPRHRVNIRSQIIFLSDDGHVQVMKVAPPVANRDSSGSGSVARR
jgi:hypothetical protein